MNFSDNFFNKVEKKTNVKKSTILDLAKKLQGDNMKNEDNIRDVIRELSKMTGKEVSKEQEDKIINTIVEENEEAIIMDFFSGSATTAHSILGLNAKDNGRRKYILVQLPEKIGYKDYNNICEIGEERIRRAGKK